MDGAQAFRLYTAHIPNSKVCGVSWRAVTMEGYPVKGAGGGCSADLEHSSD